MKLYKNVKRKALLLFVALLVTVLLSGCISSETWCKFTEHGEKDVYTCTLNDDTQFWYSPTYLYGEWTKGEETVPMTIYFTAGFGNEYETNCLLRFHDEYGSCMAELVMEMNEYRTNSSKSLCEAAGKLIVYDVEKQEMLQSLVDGIEFVGQTVYKAEKDIPSYTPIQQSIFDFLAQSEPGFYCEDFDFWFTVANPTYYREYLRDYSVGLGLINGKWISFDVVIRQDTLTKSAWFYNYEPGMVYLPMVCLDENGYFLRYKEGDTIHCARLERVTAETDPRKEIPFYAFMTKTDDQGNSYRFVCESEGFYIDGDTQTGVWTKGTDNIAIKLEERNWGEEIIISTEKNDKAFLMATFVELLEDGSARFKIKRYTGAFPPTEIILKKEIIEQ